MTLGKLISVLFVLALLTVIVVVQKGYIEELQMENINLRVELVHEGLFKDAECQ